MIKIIDKKSEGKKYTDAIAALFRIYRINGELSETEEETIKEFSKIVTAIKSDNLYKEDCLKKEIVKAHLLQGEPLNLLAERLCYSTSYVYSTHQAIIKDFAMLIFKVVIL